MPTAAAARIAAAHVHIHITVPDLAGGVAFYRSFLGCDPVKERPGYAKFLPTWAPLNLALSEGAAAQAHGVVGHLGLHLPDPVQVRVHLARVKAAGLATRVEIGVDCCYANQDKFWVRDPAGMEWEVYVLNHDVETMEPQAIPPAVPACCAPGCCPK